MLQPEPHANNHPIPKKLRPHPGSRNRILYIVVFVNFLKHWFIILFYNSQVVRWWSSTPTARIQFAMLIQPKNLEKIIGRIRRGTNTQMFILFKNWARGFKGLWYSSVVCKLSFFYILFHWLNDSFILQNYVASGSKIQGNDAADRLARLVTAESAGVAYKNHALKRKRSESTGGDGSSSKRFKSQ